MHVASTFNPTLLKTVTPGFSNVTTMMGGIDVTASGKISVYDSSYTFTSTYFALDRESTLSTDVRRDYIADCLDRGYLYAPTNGTYTFNVTGVDDLVLIWLGTNAYSGWTRANANEIVAYNQTAGHAGLGVFTYTMTAASYNPFRIVFAQGQGAAVFSISIKSPDSTVLLDSKTSSSPYVLTHSCDNTTAPAYAAWGKET